MMKFNYDSPFFQFMTTLSHFVILNFLFLLTCVPILTIGCAISALYETTLTFADQERGYLIKGYMKALKNNWKRSTIIYLFFLIPILFLIYSAFFWHAIMSIIGTILMLLSSLLALALFVAFIYAEALNGHFDASLKQTVKNAILLTIAHPFWSMVLLLFPITSICLLYLIPFFKIFLLLIGVAFLTYCSSFLMLHLFKKYTIYS